MVNHKVITFISIIFISIFIYSVLFGKLFSQTFSQERFEKITNNPEVCKSSSQEMQNWLKENLPDSIKDDVSFYLQTSYLLNQSKEFNLQEFENSIKLQYKKDNTDAAWVSVILANGFLNNKLYKRAESHANQILHFYNKSKKNSYNYIETAYQILGHCKKEQQYYNEAISLYERCVSLCDEKEQKPDIYVSSLVGIGECYMQLSQYKNAIAYFERYKLSANQRDLIYWGMISNYALCNAYIGNYSIAINVGQEVLVNIKKLAGEQSSQYINALNNLGIYYSGVGDEENVSNYIIEASKIAKEMYENDKEYASNYALSLLNLSEIYASNEMYNKAAHFAMKGLSLLDSIGQKNSRTYREGILSYINHLIDISIETENYEEVIKIIYDQLAEQKEYIHIYAELKYRLGECFSLMENYNRSISCYNEYLSLIEKLSGKYTPNYIKGLESKIRDIYFSGDKEGYFLALKEEGDIIKEFLETQLCLYLDSEKGNFSDYFNKNFNEAIPELIFIAEKKESRKLLKELTYDNSLLFKGLLLNNTKRTVELLRKNYKSEYETLLNYKQQIGLEKLDNTNSDSLQSRISKLERKLRLEFANFKDFDIPNFKNDWKTIKGCLSANEVAIEFIKHPWSMYETDSIVYSAIAIRSNMEEPVFIPLMKESLIQSFYEKSDMDSLCNSIWYSIMHNKIINPGDHIYFSPSGILHQIPIESLPIGDGKVMSDVYHMHRVSSTRELAMKKEKVKYEKAVLYGNLNYEMTDEEMITESQIQSDENEGFFVSRGLLDDSIRGYVWTKLGNTEREVEYISDLLNKNQVTTATYQHNKGNEESFKSLSGKGYNIIHLATHGFFYPDKVAKEKDYFKPTFMNTISTYHPDFSMWRSGLVLSGGNRAWKGDTIPDQVEDGILKAQEISDLDLRGADLVVLSACQTGLGEITSDGVFGLQRAFKMAGAQTIVMSLTEVDDQTTMAMMNKFYTNLFSGQSKHDAFYNAQRYIRSIKPDPKYWAGWIMLD